MATVHFTTINDRETAGKRPKHAAAPAHRDDLPLLRFGLRQLLVFVALVCALFAALASSTGLAACVTLLAVLVVTMHVFATTLGSHLRARADRDQVFEKSEQLPIECIATASQRHERMAVMRSNPRSPWHARGTTALPWLTRLVIVAIACGGLVGSAYLAYTIGYRTSPAGVIVGGISVAVLFGWITFLFGSFYGVFRHGFRDAAAEPRNDIGPYA